MKKKTYYKYLLAILGSVCLSLGAIGIFVPVLPTTPFLLLACLCYIRSSQKLYDWLMNHRVLGAYIHNYLVYKAIRRRDKIAAIALLWLSLGVSAIFVRSLHVKILLLAVGAGVSVHLFRLKTISKEQQSGCPACVTGKDKKDISPSGKEAPP